MVRRHLLPPAKFEAIEIQNNNENVLQQPRDTMARIIPKSYNNTVPQSSSQPPMGTQSNSLATIHLGNNLKCPVKSVLLHGDLNEALASEMMPPPPPPPLIYSPPLPHTHRVVTPPPHAHRVANQAYHAYGVTRGVVNDLLPPQEGEVEFYKSESEGQKGGGSVSSGGSANHDDFDEEDVNAHLGRIFKSHLISL